MLLHLSLQAEYRILIIGVDKAGKTTLLERIKSMYILGEGLPPNQILPTVGESSLMYTLIPAHTYTVGRVFELHPSGVLLAGEQMGFRTPCHFLSFTRNSASCVLARSINARGWRPWLTVKMYSCSFIFCRP